MTDSHKTLFAFVRGQVAGENHHIWSFFIVAAVYHIEEHIGALFVKLSSAHFIDNQARKLNEPIYYRAFMPEFQRITETLI